MSGTHDHHLVMLSVAVATLASFTALSLASRIRASAGRARNIWLAAAAVTLGGGIWSIQKDDRGQVLIHIKARIAKIL